MIRTNILFCLLLCLGHGSYRGEMNRSIRQNNLPSFSDSVKFTDDWRNDKSIKKYFSRLKSTNDYDVIECYFTLKKDNILKSKNCEENRLKEFYQAFLKYRWKMYKGYNFYDYDGNVKLIIEIFGNKGIINVEIKVLSKYDPKNFLLDYKTIYSHREKFD